MLALLFSLFIHAEPPPCPSYFNSYQCQIFKDTNAARKAHKLAELKPSFNCTKLAQAHSLDMFKNGKLFHTSPQYGPFSSRLERYKVPGTWHGENVFWSSQGVAYTPKVVDGWMKSPGHRKNILNTKATAIGIGLSKGYFAQCFSNE
jgi:uncharacterized protein YkwD